MRTKRILAFVLCALMLAAFIPAAPKTAYADDDLSWTTEECPKAKEWGWDPPLHDIHWETLQQGNCAVETITKTYCSQCGRSSISRYAPGHDWDEGVGTKEATCTEAGVKTFTCLRDGSHTRTESISALGHNYVNGACTRCGAKDHSVTLYLLPQYAEGVSSAPEPPASEAVTP